MKLHHSQTECICHKHNTSFNTYMKLHHSQTKYASSKHSSKFNTYMKLHHSQTMRGDMTAKLFV